MPTNRYEGKRCELLFWFLFWTWTGAVFNTSDNICKCCGWKLIKNASEARLQFASPFYDSSCSIIWWARSCLMRMSVEIIILTKDRSSPPEKDVGGCVGLLHQSCCTANLIFSGLVSTVGHPRLAITRPREPEKESKITLRSWVALTRCRPKPVYPWQHQDGIHSQPLTPLSQRWVLRQELEIWRDSI